MMRRSGKGSDNDLILGEEDKKLHRHRSLRQLTRRQIQLFVGVLLLLGAGLFLASRLLARPENRNPNYHLSKQTQLYQIIRPTEDTFFLEKLRLDPIIEIQPYDAGLAEKYICVIQSGYQALIKPMEEFRFFPWQLPVWDAGHLSREENAKIGRASNEYQGWGEVMGFYVDRALNWYKKPPMTGRLISNKVLYADVPLLSGGWKRWVPEYQVPVSITLWMEDTSNATPSLQIQSYLTHKYHDIRMKNLAIMISKKIIFDFLLDDHDSQAGHNYRADAEGTILHWDSGLAWRHGPYAREKCTELLCGAVPWVEFAERKGQQCQPICRFSEDTYRLFLDLSRGGMFRTVLRNHNLMSTSLEDKLSTRVMKLVEDDPTFPVVHYGFFYIDTHVRLWSYHKKVRFILKNYLEGLDQRVQVLLEHMNNCIQLNGVESVLL